jgi:hypothetical protein
LLQLLDGRVREQIRIRAPFQLAMNSLIVGIRSGQHTLGQSRPCQALGDDKRIVAERFKKLAQHAGLFGVLCHAIHFRL